MDQRGEGLDVGAHDDDVAGFERRVGGQEVEDGVAHHLHLPAPPVTGVDGQAGVAPVEDGPVVASGQRQARRRPVGPHVGLDPPQERGWVAGPRLGGIDRMVMVDDGGVVVDPGPALRIGGGEDELHLPGVASPRPQQRVGGQPGRRVGGPGNDRRPPAGALRDPPPQLR